MARPREHRLDGARSTISPAYITATSSHVLGHDAQIVGDQDDGGQRRGFQLAQEIQDLLPGW